MLSCSDYNDPVKGCLVISRKGGYNIRKHSAISQKPLKRLKEAFGETSSTGLKSGVNEKIRNTLAICGDLEKSCKSTSPPSAERCHTRGFNHKSASLCYIWLKCYENSFIAHG